MPSGWAKHFAMRAKHTSEKLAEYLDSGSQPFLVVHKLDAQDGYAIPAVKCQAYALNAIAAAGGVYGVIESTIRHSEKAYPNFKLEELEREMLVAGTIGSKLTVSMSVLNEEGESFRGLTEMYFIPTRDLVFLIALTGASDDNARPKSELSEILRSVRIK